MSESNGTEPFVADLKRWCEWVEDLPPVPHVIVARYDVPAGQTFSYYDAEGRWIVYANRADLEELPRESAAKLDDLCRWGIPVRYE